MTPAGITMKAPWLAVFALVLALSPFGALAQQASDLDCRGCVEYWELAPNSVTGYRIRNNSVRGEDIRDGTLTADDFQSGAVAASLLKSTWIVGPIGTAEQNCAQLKNTLAAAEAFAAPDNPQALWIEPGTYFCGPEGLTINSGISLRGEGPFNTRIASGQNRVLGSFVQIRDLELQAAYPGGEALTLAEGVRNVTLENVWMRGAENATGLRLTGLNKSIVVRDSTLDFTQGIGRGVFSWNGDSELLLQGVSLFGAESAIDLWVNDLALIFTSGVGGAVFLHEKGKTRCVASLEMAGLMDLPPHCADPVWTGQGPR